MAYDLWSNEYDHQPQNLMLHLDAQLVQDFLKLYSLKNKHVIDIGCGTGRHWNVFYTQEPASVTGFDISKGMLEKLKEKFPDAQTVWLEKENSIAVKENVTDVLISTLTIAHVSDIENWFRQWTEFLKSGGIFFITDFHPLLLAKGGERTFVHNGITKTVVNHVHTLNEIIAIAAMHGLELQYKQERFINEEVKQWYWKQNALHVYERHFGEPVIYSLIFKKNGVL